MEENKTPRIQERVPNVIPVLELVHPAGITYRFGNEYDEQEDPWQDYGGGG